MVLTGDTCFFSKGWYRYFYRVNMFPTICDWLSHPDKHWVHLLWPFPTFSSDYSCTKALVSILISIDSFQMNYCALHIQVRWWTVIWSVTHSLSPHIGLKSIGLLIGVQLTDKLFPFSCRLIKSMNTLFTTKGKKWKDECTYSTNNIHNITPIMYFNDCIKIIQILNVSENMLWRLKVVHSSIWINEFEWYASLVKE